MSSFVSVVQLITCFINSLKNKDIKWNCVEMLENTHETNLPIKKGIQKNVQLDQFQQPSIYTTKENNVLYIIAKGIHVRIPKKLEKNAINKYSKLKLPTISTSKIISKNQCLELQKNNQNNPITNRKIDPTCKGGIFNKLKQHCLNLYKIDISSEPVIKTQQTVLPEIRSQTLHQHIQPMLVKKYDSKEKWIKDKVIVQPKLDGVRCIALNSNNEWKLFSREKNEFKFLNHIKLALSNQVKKEIILDGELYIHNLSFQKISEIVSINRLIPDKKEKLIEYHIYDIVSKEAQNIRIEKLFSLNLKPPLYMVENYIVNTHEDVLNLHKLFVEKGYEGTIMRKFDTVYQHKRTPFVKKIKDFDTNEFKIVDYVDGKGKDKSLIIFICETNKGKRFACRPKASNKIRREMFLNGDEYIDKSITVQHQGFTDEGLPRFPVCLTIRDYEF